MNMIDGWPAPWWCVTLVVFLAVSGFLAWCAKAAQAMMGLWEWWRDAGELVDRLADPGPCPDEPGAYPVDPPPGYHWEVHDENWLDELPAARTGEQLGFLADAAPQGGYECPVCHDTYYNLPGHMASHDRDRRESLDLADDTRTWAWGPGGPASLPASLPVFSPAITAAIDQLHEAEERHYLAEVPIPDFINEDLAAAGFKTYATNAAAIDSIVMRAIQ